MRFLLLFAALLPVPALAQQPLDEFVRSARDQNLDLRAARAALSQARSQVDEARARLLPSASAIGTYTRNEREVSVTFPDPETGMPRENVFTPSDQLDARFTIIAPLLDLSAWATFLSSEAIADASGLRAASAERDVEVAVVMLWHQLVASRLLVGAAERSLEVAERNRTNAAARVEVGTAPQLELARAEAEAQRARQNLAEARLQATLTANNLENATGLAPSADSIAELDDDLREEPPLERYLVELEHHPALLAANAEAVAAARAEHAAWLTLAPTISAQFTERLTNASGFGPDNVWAASVTATWTLDFGRPASIGTRGAAAEVARVRLEQARQAVETQIFDAWHRVDALRARAAAARAALEASRRASDDARARFDAGAATQLEVIQADRDLFAAEVARIQADAELRVARLALRIRSGVDP